MKARLKSRADRESWERFAAEALAGNLAAGMPPGRAEARAARAADRLFARARRRTKK